MAFRRGGFCQVPNETLIYPGREFQVFLFLKRVRLRQEGKLPLQAGPIANDIEKVKSGDSEKIARRAKNKYVGRKLVRKAWKIPF